MIIHDIMNNSIDSLTVYPLSHSLQCRVRMGVVVFRVLLDPLFSDTRMRSDPREKECLKSSHLRIGTVGMRPHYNIAD